jgi:hypothetical protein
MQGIIKYYFPQVGVHFSARSGNEVHRVLKAGGYALIYDLVRKLPAGIVEEARREFGPLRTWMLWLHSFEEPFYSSEAMEALVPATSFRRGQTQFVGVLRCLLLRKTTTADAQG